MERGIDMPKPKLEMIVRSKGEDWEVSSESKEGVWHTVKIDRDRIGNWDCGCRSFRCKLRNPCKHIMKVISEKFPNMM
jgi:hypothetical protein